MSAVDALVEIFTWIGFGAGAALAGVSLLVYLLDGTWLPVRGVVEDADLHRVVRWFDENGDVNEAPLSDVQERQLGGRDMADIFYRRGWRNRMRFTRGSSAVRAIALFAVGFLVLGLIAVVVSWVLLFTQG